MKIAQATLVVLALGATTAVAADAKVEAALAKAEDQLQKGRSDEAVKTMQKLVAGNATSEAYLALARIQEKAGTIDEAAAAIAKAVELSASGAAGARAEALAAKAGLELRNGSSKEALAHAKEAADLQATPTTLAVYAKAQARAGDPTAALQTADRAVQSGPTSGMAHEARGQALLALGKSDEAAAAFRKALEVEPKNSQARVGLAQALLAQGKAGEAVAEAKKATEENPKSGEAFATWGLAILAENPKNWNEAIAQAQQGAFLTPHNPNVQYAVGKIFEQAGNFDQAAAAYRRALQSDPSFGPARAGLVAAQVRTGDVDQVLPEAQKLAQEAPNNGEAQLIYGRLLLRKKSYADAVAPLEKAAALIPGSAEAQALLGTAYQYTGKSDQALQAYQRAVQLAPDNVDYRETYGLLLGLNDEFDKGIAELQKVISNPGYKSADAYINLGWIYRSMQPRKTPESIAAYKKALEIDPKNVQAALGLGWAYSYGRDWNNSIAAFQKALEIDPSVAPTAWDSIAWAHFFNKDMAKTREAMEKMKAAGGTDTKLAQNIERYEAALKAGAEAARREAERAAQEREASSGDDIVSLARKAQSRNPSVRLQAARDLGGMGRAGVEYLIYLLSDPDWDVRTQAARSLGAMGPNARDALGALNRALAAPRIEITIATKEQMNAMMKDEDFRKAVREAIAKIQR